MIHYNYSAHQLENEAEKLLAQFDPERLKKPKPIDVYAVIEKCLGVDYDWKYITPDQSILGATAFKKGSAVKVVRGGSSGSYTYTITDCTVLTDADYVVASDYAVGDKRIEVYPVKDITNLV